VPEAQQLPGVAELTLDSPANRNALSARVRRELLAALDAAEADPAVRVVLISHTGPAFSAGLDLREVTPDVAATALTEFAEILRRLTLSALPVVVRVGGAARAGGLGLVAAGDIVIASTEATFGLPEVRVGLVPALVARPLRSRLSAAALRTLMLTGEPIDAAEAHRIGLVDQVVRPRMLDAAVSTAVELLRRGSPDAIAAVKRLSAGNLSTATYEQLRGASLDAFESGDAAEGLAAWRERRPTRWSPRAQ
jgi:methylglutaconyl-CoA hydratase